MRELGYVEGKTVVFETRNADGRYDRLRDLVTELITSKVDIIGEFTCTEQRCSAFT